MESVSPDRARTGRDLCVSQQYQNEIPLLRRLTTLAAYLVAAEHASGPLLSRLRGVQQPVIRTGNACASLWRGCVTGVDALWDEAPTRL